MKKKILLLFLSTVIFGLKSCVFSKLLVHWIPSVDDHIEAFKRDTIRASGKEHQVFFPKVVEYQMPNFRDWLPSSAFKHGEDLAALLRTTSTTSLIVVHRDSLLFEAYSDANAKYRAQTVFSVTKAFIASLAYIAEAEGYLTLTQPVADFLPAFNKKGRSYITLQHLLDMTSGLDWNDETDLIKMVQLYYSSNQQQLIERKAQIASSCPGDLFTYKSISTQILTICLEKAINQPIATYLEAKIWKPLGMQDNAYFTLDSKKQKNTRGFGGLAVSPRDMLRFGKLLLNEGEWQGQQILPKHFVKKIKERDPSSEHWWGYSNCFWRNGYMSQALFEERFFYAAGFHGQFIYVDPINDLLIVRTGEKETFRWTMAIGRLAALITHNYNVWTCGDLTYLSQLEGEYKSMNGLSFELKKCSQESKKEHKQKWIWIKKGKYFSLSRHVKYLYDFDEISIGNKKLGQEIRLIAHIKEGKVIGVYLDDRKKLSPRYFYKCGTVEMASQ